MNNIRELAVRFRKAIELALNAGEFDDDSIFRRFPKGCCGDTSDLLAQYFFENGIITQYVCGVHWGVSEEGGQSHAWLITDNHIVVDITGDQFKASSLFLNYDNPVYVGEDDDFHRLFQVEDRDVYEFCGLDTLNDFCTLRLWGLYQKILKYVE